MQTNARASLHVTPFNLTASMRGEMSSFHERGAQFYVDSRPAMQPGPQGVAYTAAPWSMAAGTTVIDASPQWIPGTPYSNAIVSLPRMLDACVPCEALHDGMTSSNANLLRKCQCSPIKGYLLETALPTSDTFLSRVANGTVCSRCQAGWYRAFAP